MYGEEAASLAWHKAVCMLSCRPADQGELQADFLVCPDMHGPLTPQTPTQPNPMPQALSTQPTLLRPPRQLPQRSCGAWGPSC